MRPRPAEAAAFALLAGALAGCAAPPATGPQARSEGTPPDTRPVGHADANWLAGASESVGLRVPGAFGFDETIPMSIDRPRGEGPFPAVVLLHDCAGLGTAASGGSRRWARELLSRGYLVAQPDSYSTRGFPGGTCEGGGRARSAVSPPERARDARAALAHLRTRPDVDPARVGVMGRSAGGGAALAAIAGDGTDGAQPAPGAAGFAAALALFPGCAWPPTRAFRPVAPLRILIGERDDWAPAHVCVALVDAARRAGRSASIKVYPGAHHAFDSPAPVRYEAQRANPNAPGGRGATTGGDAAAWADSVDEVAGFFGAHLGATRGDARR